MSALTQPGAGSVVTIILHEPRRKAMTEETACLPSPDSTPARFLSLPDIPGHQIAAAAEEADRGQPGHPQPPGKVCSHIRGTAEMDVRPKPNTAKLQTETEYFTEFVTKKCRKRYRNTENPSRALSGVRSETIFC